MKRFLLWGITFFFTLLIGFFLSAYLFINSYLKSKDFHRSISQKTSDLLNVDGDYLPLQWNGENIYSDGFAGIGRADGLFTQLRANHIQCHLNLRSLLKRTLQIDELEVQYLEATLSNSSPSLSTHNQTLKLKPIETSHSGNLFSWSPKFFNLRKMTFKETDLLWNDDQYPGAIRHLQLTITPEASSLWKIEGINGELIQKGLPTLKIESLKLSYHQAQLFITQGRLQLPDEGTLDVSGDIGFTERSTVNLQTNFKGIRSNLLLPENWRARLTGNLSGNFKLKGDLNGRELLSAEGSMHLTNGKLEALPILDQIALFTHTEQFRQIILQKSSADISWNKSELNIDHLLLESEGLLRIEGDGRCKIVNGMVDGNFQVGIIPSSLRWLPGAQSKVFTTQREGYLWTNLHLSGPVDHPNEDLSPRLIAAAQAEIIDSIKTNAEKVSKGAIDLLKPFLQ